MGKLNLRGLDCVQEAEERKQQQEAEAAEAAKAAAKAEAEAKDPVLQLRKAAGTKSPEQIVKLLGEMVTEGGAAVRMRVLYEVRATLGWALLLLQEPSCTVKA